MSSSTDRTPARRRKRPHSRRHVVAGAFAALALAAFAPASGAEPASKEQTTIESLPPLARLRVVEFETALAKGKGVYLVLDPGARALTVKSRGLELAKVPLDDVALLEFRPLFGGGKAPELVAPTVWKITSGPGDADRETIAPPVLRPYSDDEEESSDSQGAAPAKKKPEEMERPSTYRVALDNGWELFVTPEAPRAGIFRRFGAAVADGWKRLKGVEPKHPPLVALVMPPATAQKLHHLFRTGNEILVLP